MTAAENRPPCSVCMRRGECEHRRAPIDAVEAAYWTSLMAGEPPPLEDELTARRIRRQNLAAQPSDGSVPQRSLLVRTASQVPMQRAVWLWNPDVGRIPCGEVTLAAGRGNVGKSPFALWLSAELSRGRLPGHFYGEKVRSAIYASEDSHAHTTVPRLEAAGADLDMVDLIAGTTTSEGEVTTLEWWRDLELIEDHLIESGAKFLAIDPLHDVYKAGSDTNKTDDVRRGLRPLIAMAHRIGVTILGLTHFNKAKTTDVASLLSGAHGLRDIVRAVLVFVETTDGQKVLGQDKNNLGRSGQDVPRITYEMDIVPLEIGGEVDEFPVFKATGTTEALIADIVGGTADTADMPLSAPLRWMFDRLRDADPYPVSASLLARESEEAGLKWNTVRRYASRSSLMESQKRPGVEHGGWEWRLTDAGRMRGKGDEE